MQSIIKPKQPNSKEWQKLNVDYSRFTMGYEAYGYIHPMGYFVLSALEVVDEPDGEALGPQYHVSISRHQGRCNRADARYILMAFDMDGAEEDNHVPHGFVRNFWKPVAERFVGYECPCKKDEPAIKEDRGDYIWRGVTK